ncbi:MAG TPA: anti-sigma factor [Roseiflexaceae bacterium]|nr:anti-sigma factor [Roseiflexaceae bacterium]
MSSTGLSGSGGLPLDEHPTELLPGYVLEALDPEETRRVAAHLRVCPACQAEAASFRAVVNLLPYTTLPQDPPVHIKRQLLARIDAMSEPEAQPRPAALLDGDGPRVSTPLRPAPARSARWMRGALAAACAAALMLGYMAYDNDRRATELAQQVAQLSEQSRIDAFVRAPDTQSRELRASRPGVKAKMYMRPGHSQAVIEISGLPAADAAHTYQCWFARNNTPVPSDRFNVGSNGTVAMLINAPEPIDNYAEVMVTLERADGSPVPSEEVVLAASL